MAQYQCPECEAILRPKQELPPGKKVKCPKCETIFEAKAMAETKPAAKAGAKPTAKPAEKTAPVAVNNDEEDNSPTYVVIKEDTEAKPNIEFGDIRSKYPKSRKGLAMAKTVKISNYILIAGIIISLAAIACFMVPVFRFVFYAEEVTPDERIRNFWMLGGGVALFIYGAVVCLGASKLQNLESYPLAMAASVMSLPVLLIGAMGIMILRDETVLGGFEEVKNNTDPTI